MVDKYSKNRATDFEDAASITISINVNGISLIPQEKKSGDENNEKEYRQVICYKKDEVNKSQDKNTRKKVNREQTNSFRVALPWQVLP